MKNKSNTLESNNSHKRTCLGCLVASIIGIIIIMVIGIAGTYYILSPHTEPHNARFHNAAEINNWYGVKIPDVVITDSAYKCMEMPAFFSEYYTNTYVFTKNVSLASKRKAVKAINNLGVDKTGDGDVEAELLENGDRIRIKFHFVHDTDGLYDGE